MPVKCQLTHTRGTTPSHCLFSTIVLQRIRGSSFSWLAKSHARTVLRRNRWVLRDPRRSSPPRERENPAKNRARSNWL